MLELSTKTTCYRIDCIVHRRNYPCSKSNHCVGDSTKAAILLFCFFGKDEVFLAILSMPDYKLIYFDIRALGEPIRWMFLVADVPFTDERIKFEDWNKVKSDIGWGKLPVLIVDGKELTQAVAIKRYLAKQFNLIPSDDFEAARADEIVEAVQDIVNVWRPFVLEQDEVKKAEKKRVINEGFTRPFFKRINDMVDSNENAYIAGGKLSWADLVVVNYIDIFNDTLIDNLYGTYPALKKLKDNVFEIPQIKEWIAKRGNSIA